MNIHLELNNDLKTIVNKFINSDQNLEFEALISRKITAEQLYKLLGVLKHKFSGTIKKSIYLNIYHKNTRVVINGINDIKDLYKNENIKNQNEFLYKEKYDEYKDTNYNFKFNLKLEDKPHNLNINNFKDNYKNIEKTYRFIERYSFFNNNIRYDISLVKQSTGLSILESNIFFKPLSYEIELEYINKNNTINNIIQEFYQNLLFTIQILDNTPYPLTNKEMSSIYSEYMKIVNHSNIGPKLVGMAKNTINNMTISDIENNNYLISAKADGENYKLFINNLGQAYLVNNNKHIINTNLTCNVINSVIDGEFINTYNSNSTLFNNNVSLNINHIFLFKAFDIYYLNGEIVYQNELRERLNLLKSIDFQKNNNFALDFSIKEFYDITKVNMIIDDDKTKKLGYNIDGIIYQPIEGYTSASIKRTNFRILKWKPEKYNSIDFLVNLKYINNKIQITFNSLNVSGLFNKNVNIMKPFQSIKPYIYNIHQQIEESIPITEENTKIENNSIVECRYDLESKRWKYIRTRPDKTIKYQSGIKNATANMVFYANDTFASTFDPITIDDISNIDTMKNLIGDSNTYYYSFGQNIGDRTDMQNFHNNIKKILIQNAHRFLAEKFDEIKCLDLGIGSGGDIKKYINTNHHNYNPSNKLQKGISLIVGIEFNKPNIEYYKFNENKYGSRAKFIIYSTDYSNISNVPDIVKNYKCYIFHGDLNKDILKKNTKLILDDYDKETFNTVWTENKLDQNKFELIISNFSFHYFIGDLQKYTNIMKTVSGNLKDNGLFIVTVLDADRVIELFNKEKTDEVDCGFAVLRKIDKLDSKKKYGIKIGVKLKTMEKEEIEYLVNFDTLVEQCNKYNMYLSSINYIKEDMEKQGYFKDIKFKYSYKLGMDEKYSYLQRYAIFQKNMKAVSKVKNITKGGASEFIAPCGSSSSCESEDSYESSD
jgi:hypothetical protein